MVTVLTICHLVTLMVTEYLELIVKWYPSNAKDNSGYGFTGKTFLELMMSTGQQEQFHFFTELIWV